MPLTEYEKGRMQNLIEKNQMFQRLGLATLSSIVNHAGTKVVAREDSGSLYQPGDEQDIEQGVVDKDSEPILSKGLPENACTPTGGTRTSKRVMALQEQDQPIRMTRQRTREISSVDAVCHAPTTDPQDGSTKDGLLTVNAHAQDDHNDSTNKDRPLRGRSVGRELDRISRGLCTKIPVHIAEGNRRPEAPMQAAKLASEAGILLRNHVPILPHWKNYKKIKDLVPDYMGKIAIQFDIDTTSKPVKLACIDLLKGGQRQMRYKLKKKFFDGIPANQVRTTSPLTTMSGMQWKELVDMWSSPKHKDKCLKNKGSREQVQYQQKTGSRCFVAHCHVVKQTKYEDALPTAIDLFKDTHCSTKTGYSENAKNAIAQMEAIIAKPQQEGQVAKTPTQAVVEVLPKSKFLQNVGVMYAAPKRSAKDVEFAKRVQELESQLHAEKEQSTDLRVELGDLKKQIEDEKDARKKQEEETENLKKQGQEIYDLLRRLSGANATSAAVSSEP